MLSIERLRERLPLVVFVLLFILLVMLVGIACACATDHPMQTIERAISAIASTPAVIEVWTVIVAAMLVVPLALAERRFAFGRASPAELQRFLF